MAITAKVSALSGALQAYAYDKGDLDLAAKVKMSKSEVLKMKDTEVDPTVRVLLSAASANFEALADFGVTEANIAEIQTSVDDFQALLGKPRTILNKKYVALDSLD